MFSLTILGILLAGTVYLAARNWTKTVGAGPTIVVVGMVLIVAFGALKLDTYRGLLREYDVCAGRVDRSVVNGNFNETLVTIIERELPDSPFGQELRAAMPEPLSLDDCPAEPTFWTGFTDGL